MQKLMPTLLAVLAILFIASLSLFTVDQRQYAMVFQFGEVNVSSSSQVSSSRFRCCRMCAISIAAY
jgi:regulator of protease activity HflC (stomatin/prohibitin superfamily)